MNRVVADYFVPFQHLHDDSITRAEGKGVGLSRMTRAGLPVPSFAGQQETYLNVRHLSEVCRTVGDCLLPPISAGWFASACFGRRMEAPA